MTTKNDTTQRTAASQITATLHDVKKACADLDERERSAILWLFHTAKGEEWGYKETGAAIGYDSTVVSRVFRGTYSGPLGKFVAKVVKFRTLYVERQKANRPPFIKTSLTARVFQVCDLAHSLQQIASIWGESQIGKTAALEEYAHTHNHGQTLLLRMPAAAGFLGFLQELAGVVGLSRKGCSTNLQRHIKRAIDSSNLLIVDEAHQAFITYQKGSAVRILEYLREIHDRCGCGIVFAGTDVWQEELEEGIHRRMLKQLRLRGAGLEVKLEDRPLPKDLDKFREYYRLPAATGRAASIVEDVVAEHGLGRLLKLYQTASRRAANAKRKLKWEDVIATHDLLAALSRRK